MVAAYSEKFVVIADSRKKSHYLGTTYNFAPIEVLPLAYKPVKLRIEVCTDPYIQFCKCICYLDEWIPTRQYHQISLDKIANLEIFLKYFWNVIYFGSLEIDIFKVCTFIWNKMHLFNFVLNSDYLVGIYSTYVRIYLEIGKFHVTFQRKKNLYKKKTFHLVLYKIFTKRPSFSAILFCFILSLIYCRVYSEARPF